jgi:hypothetical protein
MASISNSCPICFKSSAAPQPAPPAPLAPPSAASLQQTEHDRALASFRSDDFDAAAAAWTALLSNAESPADDRRRAQWHSFRAACRMRLGTPAEAMADCDVALQIDSTCVHACHIRDMCQGAAHRAAAGRAQPSAPADIAVSITNAETSAAFPLEGVTPRYLRMFIEHCGGRRALAGLSCSDVKRRFLLPLTELRQSSVARVMLDDYYSFSDTSDCDLAATRANVFISHVWNPPQCDACRSRFNHSDHRPLRSASCAHTACAACWSRMSPDDQFQLLHVNQDELDVVATGAESTFLDTVDAVLAHCDALPPRQQTSIVLWMDLFSVCQHELPNAPARPSSWWLNTFKQSISSIGSVLMVLSPWENPRALQRTWCVLELFLCKSTNGIFNVAISATERQKFLNDIQDPRKFYRMLSRVQVERSSCGKPQDRADILGAVETYVGFDNLDSAVLRQLETWMLATLEKEATLALDAGDAATAAALSFALGNLRSDMGLDADLNGSTSVRREFDRLRIVVGPNHTSTLLAQETLARMCLRESRRLKTLTTEVQSSRRALCLPSILTDVVLCPIRLAFFYANCCFGCMCCPCDRSKPCLSPPFETESICDRAVTRFCPGKLYRQIEGRYSADAISVSDPFSGSYSVHQGSPYHTAALIQPPHPWPVGTHVVLSTLPHCEDGQLSTDMKIVAKQHADGPFLPGALCTIVEVHPVHEQRSVQWYSIRNDDGRAETEHHAPGACAMSMQYLLGSGSTTVRSRSDRLHLYRYMSPYIMLCSFLACSYMVLLGHYEQKINELREKSNNLASFSLENFKLCLEFRRQQLGHQHIDVLRLLVDAGEDLEESLTLQKAVLGDSHIVCLETAVEQARREQRSLEKEQKAFLYDNYNFCCPSNKLVALHEFDCKRMLLLSKEALLFRNQRAQLGLLHPDTLKSIASLSTSLSFHHGVRWAIRKMARTLGPQHVDVKEMLEKYNASFSVFSRLLRPALVFVVFYVAPPLLWYLALLVGPYYKFIYPAAVAFLFAFVGSALFFCYTLGHIRLEWIMATKLRIALAQPDVATRPEVQAALVVLRELDAIFGPLPTFDRLGLLFKRVLLCEWRCGDSDLLRLPRHFVVAPSIDHPQPSSRVLPSTLPPNHMNLPSADLEAAHVMQQLVEMGFSPSVAQRAIASVGSNRAIEHLLAG